MKYFTNVNAAPHITHNQEFGNEAVLEGNVVCLVFIFLGEYISQIYFAWDMLDARKVGLHGLVDCILVRL